MSIELNPNPHQSYSNGFFLLRMALIINGQPAEISCNDKGMLTLNCRYPSIGITFASLFNDVSTVVEKYGLSGITNYWCEDVPLFQLKFSTPDGMKRFISTAEMVQNELASKISARLAEKQRNFHPDTSQAHLPITVYIEVFLVTPDPINRDAVLRAITAESLSACLSLWRESTVFDFGALFRAYKTRHKKDYELPTLHQLLANLSEITEWYQIGIYLDIPESDLEKIKYENHWNVTDCKCEMLSTWLRRNPQPTWAAIVTTLNDIGRKSLAYKIALKYGIPTPSCSLKAKRIPTLKNHDPVQQKICNQVEEIRSGIESKDMELMVKKQTSSGAQNARALAREKFEQVKRDAVQVQTRVTQLITKRTEMLKLLEQKERGLRTLQRIQEREKGEFQSLVNERNNEIARLKQELETVQAELAFEKQKASSLQKQLQQATEDLAVKSARVQELEWARQKLETLLDSERKRVDQLLMQQTAASNSQQQYTKEIQSQLSAARQQSETKVTEMEALRQTIALKEGEVKGLCTQLQSQEALLQKLLTQPPPVAKPDPTQELKVEEEFEGLTIEVAELRARLVEVENMKHEAQRQMEVAQLESRLLLELTTELRAARQPPTVKPKPEVRQPPTVKRTYAPVTALKAREEDTCLYEPLRQETIVQSTNETYQDLLLPQLQKAPVTPTALKAREEDTCLYEPLRQETIVQSTNEIYQDLLLPQLQKAPVTPDLPSGPSSPMVSAAASSATHAKPEELYEEVRVSAFSDTGHPILSQSPKAFERHTTALDQPKQAERQQEDLVWADGAEVEGKYNFPGSADNDLPFKRGDALTIICRSKDPNWYKAKRYDGLEGMVPYNYVQSTGEASSAPYNYVQSTGEASSATHAGPKQAVNLQSMPWFHGDISRENAEQLLKPFKNGNFLVREAQHFKGDYTLCVSYGTKVEHYRVRRDENSWVTFDDEQYFENLFKLVEHYQRDADGLCCRLKHSVMKTSGNSEYTVSVQDFKDRGWATPRKSLNKKNLIGKGEFKDVWLGEYQGQKVAITMTKDLGDPKACLAEAACMTTLRHPNLVSLIGVSLDELPIYLITEYMAKGSLMDYLRSRGRAHISKLNQLDFARDVCKGMVYMETQNFVHRNLAARNVLIGDDNTAKVSDFRLTRDVLLTLEQERLLVKWTAPEALSENKFSNKSDVWSYGILLWEIYSYGRTPYPKLPIEEVHTHIAGGNRMNAPVGCPDGVYHIMMECWDKEASIRPNFAQIETMLV